MDHQNKSTKKISLCKVSPYLKVIFTVTKNPFFSSDSKARLFVQIILILVCWRTHQTNPKLQKRVIICTCGTAEATWHRMSFQPNHPPPTSRVYFMNLHWEILDAQSLMLIFSLKFSRLALWLDRACCLFWSANGWFACHMLVQNIFFGASTSFPVTTRKKEKEKELC